VLVKTTRVLLSVARWAIRERPPLTLGMRGAAPILRWMAYQALEPTGLLRQPVYCIPGGSVRRSKYRLPSRG